MKKQVGCEGWIHSLLLKNFELSLNKDKINFNGRSNMQNKKGLFVIHVNDDYLETLKQKNHTERLAGESEALNIWDNLLTNVADETQVKIEQTDEFQPIVQYVLEQMAKGEKDFSYYYDGDFNDNIWSFLCERINIRVERPIRIELNYVINEKFIDYRKDSDRSNLYIHNLLRLISQIPAFDVEIYEAEKKEDAVLFSYEDVFNGVGFCDQDYLEGLCICHNNKLGQLSLQELKESFSHRKKAMSVKGEFTDFIDVLKNVEKQSSAFAYLPHIYLYMGSRALKEKMYRENAIDHTEYEIWGLFHSFMYKEKVRNSTKFIVSSKALTDAYEHGFVKVHGGVMRLEQYKNDFLEDLDKVYQRYIGKEMLVLGSEKTTTFEIPNVMIYSEPKHTLLIRTNVNKRYRLARIAY
jgi:hypothetical protein